MWVNICKQFKAVLAADLTVAGLANTIRFGIPVRNIVDSDYPVVIVGRASLNDSQFRGTKDQDRTTVWSVPVYIAITESISDFEDGTVFDTLDTLEDAVVTAILTDLSFNNESPFLDIELETTEPDEETQPPVMAITYRFTVSQINSF